MRLFIGILLALVVAAALTAAMQYDSGYILLAWGQTTVEMTIWVGLAVLVIFLLLCGLAFVLLRRGTRFLDRMGNLRSDRRDRRDRGRNHRGLVAYHEGNWARARNLLIDAVGDSERPLNNYLLAARASHALGDDKAVNRYLTMAAATGGDADVAAALTRAELECKSGQFAAAQATLDNLRQAKAQPTALCLYADIYCGLPDWGRLRKLLPELRRQKLYSDERREHLERQALQGELGQFNTASDKAALLQWWQTVPGRWQTDGELLFDYLTLLQRRGEEAEAAQQLQNVLKTHWNPRLVALYGEYASGDPKRALRVAEGWLKQHADEPELLLTLGRLSLRNKLWGKARDYFESANRHAPSAQACLELARLHRALGEAEQASHFSGEALRLMGQGLPELPLP